MIAEQAEQQGRRDADLLALDNGIVLHRILATDTGQSIGPTDLVEGTVGSYQLCQFVSSIGGFLRLYRVTPAEIVEPGYLFEVNPDTNRIS